ncbi:MAG: CDP-alcohol phosphatidyltransferase family protein [Planctomycetes bacterium]|nr:CDP-alcohol phosphatidyltransferase family protein [Planctomycetota bacterium]
MSGGTATLGEQAGVAEAAAATLPTVSAAVLDARGAGAWLRVGGGPLVLRLARILARLGVRRLAVLAPADARELPAPSGATMERPASLRAWTAERRVLLVDASVLIDPRALEALLRAPDLRRLPRSLETGAGGISAAVVAAVDAEWQAGLFPGASDALPLLDLQAIDTHHREQRTQVPLHLRELSTPAEARHATWELILATQKKVQDLPSEYIDPPFENALTYALCATPVTPNQVTYACFLVAVGIGCLFLRGELLLGAALTYLVEWLDGVDGKLARVKLQFSKIGEYESIFDYFYENFWWFSITWSVAGLGHGLGAWRAGGLLMACDLVENILVTLWSLRGARISLDELAPIDARFRRIGGRRNIYCALFLVGFLLGFPYETLWVVAGWAAVTAGYHTTRLALNWRRAPTLGNPKAQIPNPKTTALRLTNDGTTDVKNT